MEISKSEAGVMLEYRVKAVTRYVVTRFEAGAGNSTGSVTGRGEYDNADVAYEVAYALCKAEHEANGGEPGDPRIKYPRHPNDPNVIPEPASRIGSGGLLASGRLG